MSLFGLICFGTRARFTLSPAVRLRLQTSLRLFLLGRVFFPSLNVLLLLLLFDLHSRVQALMPLQRARAGEGGAAELTGEREISSQVLGEGLPAALAGELGSSSSSVGAARLQRRAALVTALLSLARVQDSVDLQGLLVLKRLLTQVAGERLLPRVDLDMAKQMCSLDELPFAAEAGEDAAARVDLLVQ